jgi:hypothetical protein
MEGAMTDRDASQLFDGFLQDLDDLSYLNEHKPLLAHYTSINVMEQILRNDELWLSNPLFMNDIEEVRFGINEGVRLFEELDFEKIARTSQYVSVLRQAFHAFYQKFNQEHAFDTYVFCLTEHDANNADGKLSMWRGYGHQGNGAALVFNTGLLKGANPRSPLLISKIRYASSKKQAWMDKTEIGQLV